MVIIYMITIHLNYIISDATVEPNFTESDNMMRTQIENMAFNHFQAGFHCAEAVSKTITDLFADRPCEDLPRMATAFGGGIGGTHGEPCGAFLGGVLALGYLYGRMEPGANKDDAYRLATEFRKRFIAKFGSPSCGMILIGFGEQVNLDKCKSLTAVTAGMLGELLIEHGAQRMVADSGPDAAAAQR